jgi:hypothetical protein
MMRWSILHSVVLGATALALAGCGTTRLTDTQRTATEQLLISNAIDMSVSQVDFTPLAGATVFFDAQFLEGTVDRGYLVSSLRQHLLASGCLLQEERGKAEFVVEARAGAIGTDRHQLLVGVPAMNVPSVVPGQPSQIPEIPFAKKTDQRGAAKIAVFAYNRVSGQPVLQSGTLQALSSAKDLWVLGAGPFSNGSIRKKKQFAGVPIPTFGPDGETEGGKVVLPVTKPAAWPEHARAAPKARVREADRAVLQPATLTSTLADLIESHLGRSKPTAPAAPKPLETKSAFSTPPPAPNSGGHAETEPIQTIGSGWQNDPGS